MTAGITGVFWLPRMAEANSIALNAGAHAVPISAAGTAWGALTGAWVDATATITRVVAELGVGMEGVNGVAALARLTGYTGWAEQQGVLAAAMGAKAAANATAYTVATLAMPSLPEIAAADSARVAAHAAGGDLDGSAEVAEAAKSALDMQAALVMETYEAATSALVSTPNSFPNPPAIANGAGSADNNQNTDQSFQNPNGAADPVQAAVAAAQAVLTDPGIAGAATQAAQVVGSVASTGVSAVGNVAGGAVAAASHALAAPVALGAGATAPVAAGGVGTAAVLTGGSALATRAVSFGGSAVGVGNSGSTLKLPEGWGAGSSAGGAAVAVSENTTLAQLGAPAPARAQGLGSGNPLLGHQAHQDEEDEADHKSADYLRGDHFGDGRAIAAGVIGGAADAGER